MAMLNKRPRDDAVESDASGALPVDAPPAGSMGNMALMQSIDLSALPVGNVETQGAFSQRIGADQIAEAWQTLLKYKEGKANLERRIVDNHQWYKLRQWDCMRKHGDDQVEPVSGWLFNAIANKHADAMDNFPRANILPREEGDKAEAEMLSSIIPVILDQCDFEQVYSSVMDDKLIGGTGVYGVFWDNTKLNGLGDIDIEAIDVINLFWESGISDIQQSRNLFYATLRDNDLLESEYPQLAGKLAAPVMDIAKYVYDDTIDTTHKSVVVDWYYKKMQDGRAVLHYCKFVAGQQEPLFATENDPDYASAGWYDHGLYPFVFDPLFSCKGTPCGFSYIDVGKRTQEYIDRGDKAIMENLLFNASPRHFSRIDGGINEQEYVDTTKKIVHVEGSLSDDYVKPIPVNPLNEIYVTVINNKIDELKETTGNRDVSSGGTTGGVTAASAIAAMQEAGSKLSRDGNKAAYRAFRKVQVMIIELIRQFYDTARCFRIIGENGAQRFVQYSNAGILPQAQGQLVGGTPMELGVEVGYRLPLFDVEVTAEKASPYSKMSQNELALQFYSAGFFVPEQADAALICLDMMDFDRKQFVMQKIAQNGQIYKQMIAAQSVALQLAQTLDAGTGGQLAETLAAQFGMQAPTATPGTVNPAAADTGSESSVTKNARQTAAEASSPR